MNVYVLALSVPGRYLVGQASHDTEYWRDAGHIHLTDPAWVTQVNGRWTFQPITLLDEFVAQLEAYAGFGLANPECTEHYEAWLSHIRNPPEFEVEESDSVETSR